jgi:hypothetical protein
MYEEQFYDDSAQPLTTSYLDFPLVSSMEVPPVELFHIHSPSPLNPLGAKGAGEGGTIPAPAAIANAVEDALRPFGARINTIPVTPPRIVGAIAGRADHPRGARRPALPKRATMEPRNTLTIAAFADEATFADERRPARGRS